MKILRYSIYACIFYCYSLTAIAGSLKTPHVFTSGTPALASEVNNNFNALEVAVNNNAAMINALQVENADLKSRLAALEAKLASMTLETVNGKPTVRFTAVNLQVVNGLGGTQSKNGTGNLIVGYDGARNDTTGHCTLGTTQALTPITDATTCYNEGGDWLISFKTGSHNIVLGDQNNYSSYGGFVAGYRNTINQVYASVTGGTNNTAGHRYASVSGGSSNEAIGEHASISGGSLNKASGLYSHISGGTSNDARGQSSVISGGNRNITNTIGRFSAISGGFLNETYGDWTSITGGGYNMTFGVWSTVTGGEYNNTDGPSSSITGGRYNYTSGSYSHISGGGDGTRAGGNIADMHYSSILGGIANNTSTNSQTIP